MSEAMTPRAADPTALLTRLKGYYEAAVQHPAYRAWREEAKLAWDFYDGHQWAPEEVSKLAELGQPAIVINKIAAKIDNLAGTEVAGRTRIAYRSRSGLGTEERTARVLTDLVSYIAERTELAHELSRTFRAGLVSGLGWLELAVQQGPAGAELKVTHEPELNVVFDPDARSADFADARFVCRERWLDEEALRTLFPDHAPQVVARLKQADQPYAGLRAEGWQHPATEVRYYDPRREKYRVVEVQYRQTVKIWQVTDPTGQERVFFSRAHAKRAAAKPGHTLSGEGWAPRAFAGYLSGSVLLHHAPLPTEDGSFTLLPYLYKRHTADGRPYGLVRGAIDPQRELNKRRSKAMHLLNTAQVIADIDAVDDPAILAREAARPDGLILKRAGKDLRIIRNADLAASQVAVMEQAGRDIQDVMGVFDETMGKPTNAQSGAAIQQRQLAGTLNQMFAFDALRRLKKALGMQLLALLRRHFTAAQVLRLTDDLHAARLIGLLRRDEGLDPGSAFDVVVEEVGDALSQHDLNILQTHRPDLLGA